jgi:hypothetical protein
MESFLFFLNKDSPIIPEAIMRSVFFALLACAFVSCQDTTGPHPESYELNQNWPNPFTDTTNIYYGVPSVGGNTIGPHVRLVVYDRFENVEKMLVDQINHPAARDTVIWNGYNAKYEKSPVGVYYIELQTLDNTGTTVQKRIAVLKQ